MFRRIAREPLLYFLAAGAALFAVSSVLAGDDDHVVVVDDAQRTQLASQWQAEMGRPPTDDELESLVARWIREEIYYRQAVAMGLDQDDAIIRRRLAQKLTFLSEDLARAGSADGGDVATYYRDHAERYREPERVSFRHVFFDPDRRRDARADARRALAATTDAETEGVAPPDGDAFMLPRSYASRSGAEIGELFGHGFADAVMMLPEGEWRGPVQSAYGWHLVKVVGRVPARQPELAEVADRVAADLADDRRRRADEAYYRNLLDQYQVVRR